MGKRWSLPWARRKDPRRELERSELESSIEDTRLAIAQAYAGFNGAADPELVESFVYEIEALRARYSYLLRRRKALEPQPVPAAQAVRP